MIEEGECNVDLIRSVRIERYFVDLMHSFKSWITLINLKGSHVEPKLKGTENITQIMWPSLYFGPERPIESLQKSPLHMKAEKMAKALMGSDMAFDFDMLITKVL